MQISSPLKARGLSIPIQSIGAKVSQGIKTAAAQASQAPTAAAGAVGDAKEAVEFIKKIPTGLRLGSSGALIQQGNKWHQHSFPLLQVVMAVILACTLTPCLINFVKRFKRKLNLRIISLMLRLLGWLLMLVETVVVVMLLWIGDKLANHHTGSMRHGFIYEGAIANCVLSTLMLAFDIFYFFKFILPQHSNSDNFSTEKPLAY